MMDKSTPATATAYLNGNNDGRAVAVEVLDDIRSAERKYWTGFVRSMTNLLLENGDWPAELYKGRVTGAGDQNIIVPYGIAWNQQISSVISESHPLDLMTPFSIYPEKDTCGSLKC
ncbi:hypothetical protein SeMB42_g06733 [Synchytrium endobioticum]|uniref:Uncharacterized protein n=1 Tax=Synchytrium endobioticum TaxID=286115 RepID=A0A507CKS2_9FUNG|nr:hypothetical protein SeMB42_g06733 [Synchytrium endobioticum]